ncbi:hypothetical protein D3C85_1498740 [compost metagenome]
MVLIWQVPVDGVRSKSSCQPVQQTCNDAIFLITGCPERLLLDRKVFCYRSFQHKQFYPQTRGNCSDLQRKQFKQVFDISYRLIRTDFNLLDLSIDSIAFKYRFPHSFAFPEQTLTNLI